MGRPRGVPYTFRNSYTPRLKQRLNFKQAKDVPGRCTKRHSCMHTKALCYINEPLTIATMIAVKIVVQMSAAATARSHCLFVSIKTKMRRRKARKKPPHAHADARHSGAQTGRVTTCAGSWNQWKPKPTTMGAKSRACSVDRYFVWPSEFPS